MSRKPRQHRGNGQKKSQPDKGWDFTLWWCNREPNPRPLPEPDSNAPALKAWLQRFGRVSHSHTQHKPTSAPRASSGFSSVEIGPAQRRNYFFLIN
jgi:hypothetical protein